MQRGGYPPPPGPPGQGPPPQQMMSGPPGQPGPPGPPQQQPPQQGPLGGPQMPPQQLPMRPTNDMMPPPPPPGPPQGGQQAQATRTLYPPTAGPGGYGQSPGGPPPQRAYQPMGGMPPPGQPQGPGGPPGIPHVRMAPPQGYGPMPPRPMGTPQSPGPQLGIKRTVNVMQGGGVMPQGPPPGPGGPNRSPMGPPNGPGHMPGMAGHHPAVSSQLSAAAGQAGPTPKKKKKLADKILPQKVRDLVPESQAYMDLLAFERKLDFTITRKRLDIQESLKRPMKHKRKLRIFISNTFFPGKPEAEGEEMTVPSWELRVEGRLIEDQNAPRSDTSKVKRKFSSFFKSLVIELDKDLYGPDNHLVEWHRTPTTTETDGFQVKRPGDRNVRCTILLLLDYQPLQFKLDSRLARLLGIHTQTRPVIINALWQYVKTHKLQDAHEREFINCDKYLEQIFGCQRMKFAEIPSRLHQLLNPPDPIVINHEISVQGPDMKKTACYDIDVEIDDLLKVQMNNFVLSTANQQEIQSLDNKIHENVETINQMKTNREFFLGFAKDPQQFIAKWLVSQNRDLKIMTDVAGNPEEERRSDFFYQAWTQEGVCRYFYGKVQTRRHEVEQALGIRNA